MSKVLRGDIQGLRAVAVLIVIGAHVGVPFLPGGYVGVDVFYVISGFLISALLFREVQSGGRFSLTAFWARRARRILPAATVVTITTVLCSLWLFSLLDARQVVIDALWATVFGANIHFARQDTSYFAQGSGASPLQHYWSLAVEEQFYVVWPLLLMGCLLAHRAVRRLLARRATGSAPGAPGARDTPAHLPSGTILTVLAVLCLASFAWSIHQSGAQPESAYFSTATRAWELGVGAMIALVPARLVARQGALLASVLAIAGVAAIASASVLYSAQTLFPGYAAALPVLGAAMLLLAGGGTPTVVSRLLSTRVLRTVGDWSFSLYLWHWPVLVLTEHAFGRELTVSERVLALALVLGLSALTYEFVEMPLRSGRAARALPRGRALLLYPLCVAMVAATAGGAWLWTGQRGGESGNNPAITATVGIDAGPEALVQASVMAGREQLGVPSDLTPDVMSLRDSIADVGRCDYTEETRRLCPRGDVGAERTVVVIGDSHARAWIPAFDNITEANGWRAFYLVKPQCGAAHVSVANTGDDQPFTACSRFHDWTIAQVRALAPDLVVVASSPPVNGVLDAGRRVTSVEALVPLLTRGYADLFSQLGDAADRVVLLRDVPKSGADPATCLTTGSPSLGTCMFQPDERSRLLGDVAVAAATAAGATVVDPTPWLCWQDECPAVIGGTLSYRDTDHITTEYAATLSDSLGVALAMVATQ